MSAEFKHCRHASCCQCGAKTGTAEHDADCPDAVLSRAMAKHREGHASRKLKPRAVRP